MPKDIETRADIDALMQAFYKQAMKDEVIGYIFTEVARLDLEKHLPIIGDFWDSILLGARNYQKSGRNPMLVHGELNLKTPLEAHHFKRWLEVFSATVDEMFVGERAEFAKLRAKSIAARMLEFVTDERPVRR